MASCREKTEHSLWVHTEEPLLATDEKLTRRRLLGLGTLSKTATGSAEVKNRKKGKKEGGSSRGGATITQNEVSKQNRHMTCDCKKKKQGGGWERESSYWWMLMPRRVMIPNLLMVCLFVHFLRVAVNVFCQTAASDMWEI